MRKNGFSLAELLITLSIIGVAAAIAVPAMSRAIPDRYKARVIKTYEHISNVTSDMIENNDLYYRKPLDDLATSNDMNENGIFKIDSQYGCVSLYCKEKPKAITGYEDDKYKNSCKYPNLLVEFLQLSSITYCDDSTKKATGISSDQASWTIEALSDEYTILVDFDRENADSCLYDKTNCKNPSKFKFHVDSYGDVSADSSDKLTAVYLNNMKRVDRNADFEEASQN